MKKTIGVNETASSESVFKMGYLGHFWSSDRFQISGNRNPELFNSDFPLHDEAYFLISSKLPIKDTTLFNFWYCIP